MGHRKTIKLARRVIRELLREFRTHQTKGDWLKAVNVARSLAAWAAELENAAEIIALKNEY